MSVLIKGFPLPNNCGACPLRLAWCRERIYMVTRPERCPLTAVPPHGDLVDKQRMAETNEQHYKIFEGEPEADYARKVVLRMLDQAPTIIPAEEGE